MDQPETDMLQDIKHINNVFPLIVTAAFIRLFESGTFMMEKSSKASYDRVELH